MPSVVTQLQRRKSLRAFKQRGYSVNSKALNILLTAYHELDTADEDLEQFLDRVFEQLSRPGVTHDSIINIAIANSIVQRLQAQDPVGDTVGVLGAPVQLFQTIDAFSTPLWAPDSKSAGARVVQRAGGLAGDPNAKARIHRARYELIRAKILRNEQFTPPASDILSRGRSAYLQLTGIESLAGTTDDRLVLGMLTQLEEGAWYLEDLHGSIRLDLTDVDCTAGLYTECSFVIAQGTFVETSAGEALFRVKVMGMPPRESRDESLASIGRTANLFGGTFDHADAQALEQTEKDQQGAMLLVLSDVHLDNPRVFRLLRHILQGYTEDGVVPVVIVLMGPFLTHRFGQYPTDVQRLTARFTALGEMIANDFEEIAKCSKFVIVPSLTDPGPGNVLPRPPLAPMFTAGFEEAIGAERVFSTTNPCRMRYMTQELVFFVEDLTRKMMRRCAIPPNLRETDVLAEHVVKTILDQAHLLPLPLASRPVVWNFDQSLWLYPAPHVVVVAEKVLSYTCRYGDTVAINPGSLSVDSSFAVYMPSSRAAQQCSVDPDRPAEDAPETPPHVSEDEQEDSDSDSGHSVKSLRATPKRGADQDDDNDDDEIDLGFPSETPKVIAETQVVRDTQMSEPTNNESHDGNDDADNATVKETMETSDEAANIAANDKENVGDMVESPKPSEKATNSEEADSMNADDGVEHVAENGTEKSATTSQKEPDSQVDDVEMAQPRSTPPS